MFLADETSLAAAMVPVALLFLLEGVRRGPYSSLELERAADGAKHSGSISAALGLSLAMTALLSAELKFAVVVVCLEWFGYVLVRLVLVAIRR